MIGLEWDRTTPEFQDSVIAPLIRAFSRGSAQDVSHSLFTLANMGVSWSSFPSQVESAFRKALLTHSDSLTPQVS